MNSDALALKNGTFASPAVARASSVLPVPGAPVSSTPFGARAPRRRYFGWFAQEVDDLVDLGLDLVDAGDIVERDPYGFGVDRLPSRRPPRIPPPIARCWRRNIQK